MCNLYCRKVLFLGVSIVPRAILRLPGSTGFFRYGAVQLMPNWRCSVNDNLHRLGLGLGLRLRLRFRLRRSVNDNLHPTPM